MKCGNLVEICLWPHLAVKGLRCKDSHSPRVSVEDGEGGGGGVTSFILRIQLFRERLSEKLCPRQSQKVIWDMISTLFLTL